MLIVDDIGDARQAMAATCRNSAPGRKAARGPCGAAIAADAAGLPYRIVLLDWQMPEMNGLQTADELLGRPCAIANPPAGQRHADAPRETCTRWASPASSPNR